MNIISLASIAHGRSGDKGNHANIAILAYTPAGFDWLKDNLNAEAGAHYFASFPPSRVDRVEAANLLALNFLVHDILEGGASQSLRSDTQGKTLALSLLQMRFAAPANLAEMLRLH